MTALMAEFIARSATGIAARVPAETEADSVAVKEAGTNRTKKQSFKPKGCFFVEMKNLAAAVRMNSVGEVCNSLILVPAPAPVGDGIEK